MFLICKSKSHVNRDKLFSSPKCFSCHVNVVCYLSYIGLVLFSSSMHLAFVSYLAPSLPGEYTFLLMFKYIQHSTPLGLVDPWVEVLVCLGFFSLADLVYCGVLCFLRTCGFSWFSCLSRSDMPL